MSELSASPSQIPAEQQAIRDKCFHPSGTFVEFPIGDVETSIPARFEKMVRMYPDRLAVKTDSYAVTYAELNAMANRVAHAIVAERGNRPEPIGILLGKGVEQIVAMLGILKAGKFFTLLDPSFPTERLSLVLENSQATWLFVDQGTQSLVRQDTPARCKLLRIDALAQSIATEDPKNSTSPHALACIVYTSGSTGRPKAVVRNHRALLHGAMLRIHTDGISHEDRLAHITDGTSNSVTNSFYALLQGAALIIIDLKHEGVTHLARWLIDEKISICLIASPVFRSLCAMLTGEERFPDLRYLRLRSDKVYSSDVALHRKHFPMTCSLATGLASSETGPLREFRITHDTELSGSEVPVGYALSDKEVLLLGEDDKDVGSNEIGEIVVRSEYLSLGYWNDPEHTAAKFKPDPQSSKKRLYYTGDLGQMLPDGCLIHKGRKDFRVKIRGYGVDLMEVERSLRRHPGVEDAVVIASRSKTDEMRLIGYFTSSIQQVPTVSALRRFLQVTLTEYMIPSVFVHIDKIPLTSNGKVDRRALPAPENFRPELDTPFVEPTTSLERELAAIWAPILSVQEVGINDKFFELGGHSLAAMRVVSQVLRKFQLELPLQSLFQSPTIAEMVAVIVEHQGERLGEEGLERMLGELELLSDEEATRLLTGDAASKSGGDRNE